MPSPWRSSSDACQHAFSLVCEWCCSVGSHTRRCSSCFRFETQMIHFYPNLMYKLSLNLGACKCFLPQLPTIECSLATARGLDEHTFRGLMDSGSRTKRDQICFHRLQVLLSYNYFRCLHNHCVISRWNFLRWKCVLWIWRGWDKWSFSDHMKRRIPRLACVVQGCCRSLVRMKTSFALFLFWN